MQRLHSNFSEAVAPRQVVNLRKCAPLVRTHVACVFKKDNKSVGMILKFPTCRHFGGSIIVLLNIKGPIAYQLGYYHT